MSLHPQCPPLLLSPFPGGTRLLPQECNFAPMRRLLRPSTRSPSSALPSSRQLSTPGRERMRGSSMVGSPSLPRIGRPPALHGPPSQAMRLGALSLRLRLSLRLHLPLRQHQRRVWLAASPREVARMCARETAPLHRQRRPWHPEHLRTLSLPARATAREIRPCARSRRPSSTHDALLPCPRRRTIAGHL